MTAPIWRAPDAPGKAGKAGAEVLTQSTPSSLVRSSGRSKPCSAVGMKFEQKRWKRAELGMTYDASSTPMLC